MNFDLYITRRFITTLMMVFGVVFGLAMLIDTIDVLGSVRGESIGPMDAVWLSSLRVPDLIVLVFPLIVLIASMVFCMTMSRHSEFVIARAVGRSMITTLIGPASVVVLSAIFIVLVVGPYAARMENNFNTAKAQFADTLENRLQVTESGLWLREADDSGVTVLNAAGSFANGTRLSGITVLNFDQDGVLTRRIEAESGFLSDDDLVLTSVKLWTFEDAISNPELSAESRGVLRLGTKLTPQQIIDGQPLAKLLFIWDLPDAIRGLEIAGSSTLLHRAHLLNQLAIPMMCLGMFLIGALFTLQTSRQGNRGIAVVGAISLGFFLFFFQRTAQTFGEAGEVQLFAATWAPPLAACFGGLAWLLRREDG
ncbi:MAG: LptF/LptG family permease [Pseudomonadota bacterium]